MRRVINVINKAQSEDIPRLLLILDAEKAFDHIEWQYLFLVLERFGIEGSFSTCLQMLYDEQYAFIDIDGQQSEIIRLGRGVRQGCPMSPLLFAVALQPLVIAIHKDKGIKELCVNKEETKIALYAGDVDCFLAHLQKPFVT